jgi:hypothetical protein
MRCSRICCFPSFPRADAHVAGLEAPLTRLAAVGGSPTSPRSRGEVERAASLNLAIRGISLAISRTGISAAGVLQACGGEATMRR